MAFSLKDSFQKAAYKAKRLILDTPIEIAIGAVLMGSIAGGISYHVQQGKEGQIPLAFSEIEQTTRDFAAKGQPVPPLTRMYSLTNDAAMKVFESNNIALAKDRSNETFAWELETRVDPSLKTHMLISEIAQEMPQDARAALGSVEKLSGAERALPRIINELDNSWDASHYDVTHIHTWTTTSCDSKGKCTTTTHSETVYDYTIHTYNYHPGHGANAARAMNEFIAAYPNLNIEERLHLASQVGADNEGAMKKSMAQKFKDKAMTSAQALGFANTWATGSNLAAYLPVIYARQNDMNRLAPAWDNAKETAHYERYRTYHHYDSGPREYQIAQQAQSTATEIYNSANKITGGIQYAGQAVPQLTEKIREYIDVTHKRDTHESNRLRAEIMQDARNIYQQNFAGGFDVQPFKWWAIALFTAIGAGLGAAAGAGVDRLIDKVKRAKTLDDLTRGDSFNRRSKAPKVNIDFDKQKKKPNVTVKPVEEMTASEIALHRKELGLPLPPLPAPAATPVAPEQSEAPANSNTPASPKRKNFSI